MRVSKQIGYGLKTDFQVRAVRAYKSNGALPIMSVRNVRRKKHQTKKTLTRILPNHCTADTMRNRFPWPGQRCRELTGRREAGKSQSRQNPLYS